MDERPHYRKKKERKKLPPSAMIQAMMSDYQIIARKFRPQTFKEVVGQEAIVSTLKNAVKFNRLAQAYLFCGPKGTGKTTLARLLAKILNCLDVTPDHEPCGRCTTCREIAAGCSLDVLEIDGASHRGIEDIRQLNETVGYAAAGRYKIYLIDEVHMLTKEAFNALLKTLEEPPRNVKFFFATTEPHKLPATILSRCQRFNLQRLPTDAIVFKLQRVADQLGVPAELPALRLIAERAEGGLRDAESLFDQVLAFEEGPVTAQTVGNLLGLTPQEVYFKIDQAGKKGDLAQAFDITRQLFSEGKDLLFFIEGLIEHLRRVLLVKIAGPHTPSLALLEDEQAAYAQSAQLYSPEQCLDLIEYLLQAQSHLRLTPFPRIYVEMIVLHVMRSHFRLPIECLVRRLAELEQSVSSAHAAPPPPALPPASVPLPAAPPQPPPIQVAEATPPGNPAVQPETLPMHRYDTLMHFAAVEWEGRLQKHGSKFST